MNWNFYDVLVGLSHSVCQEISVPEAARVKPFHRRSRVTRNLTQSLLTKRAERAVYFRALYSSLTLSSCLNVAPIRAFSETPHDYPRSVQRSDITWSECINYTKMTFIHRSPKFHFIRSFENTSTYAYRTVCRSIKVIGEAQLKHPWTREK